MVWLEDRTVASALDRPDDGEPISAAAALAVANVAALELGWRLFGPFLRAFTGLDDAPMTELQRRIDDEALRIIQGNEVRSNNVFGESTCRSRRRG
ncbi:hypothetical protein [Nocardia violaceofusca]|uniref:hypothetical protein n=1 Tax=Nocardia violaceofusca TaxID=941182 RepID=UPI0007A3A07F